MYVYMYIFICIYIYTCIIKIETHIYYYYSKDQVIHSVDLVYIGQHICRICWCAS